MKLVQVTDARFNIALQKLMGQQLPLRVAFKLKGIKAKIDEEAKRFEEVRQSALECWGSKSEDGKLIVDDNGAVKFSKENLESFAKELNELGQTEIFPGTITASDLGDKISLSAEDVIALDELLVE